MSLAALLEDEGAQFAHELLAWDGERGGWEWVRTLAQMREGDRLKASARLVAASFVAEVDAQLVQDAGQAARP